MLRHSNLEQKKTAKLMVEFLCLLEDVLSKTGTVKISFLLTKLLLKYYATR